MGGLKTYMPQTRWTFLIATCAITGTIPLSGFFSKDEILGQALRTGAFDGLTIGVGGPHLTFLGPLIWALGSATALLTAVYMWRCYYLTFEGEYRGGPEVHPHESSPIMIFPLWVLAFLSIFGLVLGLPEKVSQALHLTAFNWEHFTEGVFAAPRGGGMHEIPFMPEAVTYAIALAIGIGGFLIAGYLFAPGHQERADKLASSFPRVHRAFENKLYVDEFYHAVIVRPLWATARILWRVVDVTLIDGLLINGSAQLVAFTGGVARRFQNGNMQRYAAVMAFGMALLVVFFFSR
jgi:NADH-quinone oxidoreductase subunit L